MKANDPCSHEPTTKRKLLSVKKKYTPAFDLDFLQACSIPFYTILTLSFTFQRLLGYILGEELVRCKDILWIRLEPNIDFPYLSPTPK